MPQLPPDNGLCCYPLPMTADKVNPGNLASDLAGRLLRSTGAATLSQAWRVLVTFGATILLRRWIPAEDWGVFSWAMVVFLVLGAVRDLGLSYHVLRVKERPYGNLLALELLWGGTLALGTFLAAPLAYWIYQEAHPDLAGVLRCMALFLFFEGLAIVPKTYFEGELQVGRALLPEVLRNLTFVVLALSLAGLGFGAYSLAFAHVAAAGVYALLLWRAAWGQMPLTWNRGQTLALLRESIPLAMVWLLVLVARSIDPLVLGLWVDSASLGIYGYAYEWATIVSAQLIIPALTRAIYPALLAFREQTGKLFQTYALATILALGLEVPTSLFLWVNAELVLRLIGGPGWEASPTYLRILCLAPLLDPFSRLGGEVLKAKHLDRQWIFSILLTALSFAIFGYIATGIWGMVGMAWVNWLALGGLVMGWCLWRVEPQAFMGLCRNLVFVYLVPLPFFAMAFWLGGENQWLRFGLSILAGALSLGIMILRYGGEFKDFFRQRKEALRAQEPGQ